jgi:hypothetical protein
MQRLEIEPMERLRRAKTLVLLLDAVDLVQSGASQSLHTAVSRLRGLVTRLVEERDDIGVGVGLLRGYCHVKESNKKIESLTDRLSCP